MFIFTLKDIFIVFLIVVVVAVFLGTMISDWFHYWNWKRKNKNE